MSGANGAQAPVSERDAQADPRLVGFLQDLIEADGRDAAARRLDVSERTLRRAVSSGQLSRKLGEALEAEASRDPAVMFGRLRRRLAALETRVAELEQGDDAEAPNPSDELQRGLETIESRLQDVERQLAGHVAAAASEHVVAQGDDADAAAPSQTQRFVPRRSFPELVTTEPAEDDERNFGDAWPLVADWREQRGLFKAHRGSLDGYRAHLRMLELELALVEEHGLTMPPAHYSLAEGPRSRWLYRQRRHIKQRRGELRRARLRRWVVRLLTLGLRG